MIRQLFMAVAIMAGLAVTISEVSACWRKRQPVYSQPVYFQPVDILTACGDAKQRVRDRYPNHNHHGFTDCGYPNATAAEAAANAAYAVYFGQNPRCSADVVTGSEKVGTLNYVGFYVCKDILAAKSKSGAK